MVVYVKLSSLCNNHLVFSQLSSELHQIFWFLPELVYITYTIYTSYQVTKLQEHTSYQVTYTKNEFI